jgi:5-formyltetrahydrofolate cyclo-ligase
MSEIAARKSELRRRMREALSRITPEQRQEASAAARDRLCETPLWKNAGLVLLYSPLPDELDLLPLVSANSSDKLFAFPRYHSEEQGYGACVVSDSIRQLHPGRYGILEPIKECEWVALNQLDLIMVPGVAFSRRGERLGRGKGFYDRLLRATKGTKVGVAFNCQIVDELPLEPHDILLDCVLMPDEWLECRPGSVLK